MGRQHLCFDSLVLDTFFYAALRKTLELTKLFSYRINKTSLRVGFEKNRIEKFLRGKTDFALRFTGSRYIFLRCAAKNTRTDETVFVSYKQDVTSSRFCKKSYREVFDGKTKFVLQFTGSRYIFLSCATKNTRTDETVFVSCKQDVTSSDFCKKNRIEKFLIHRQNLCFDSLVLDTSFCAALRKILELTERLTRAN